MGSLAFRHNLASITMNVVALASGTHNAAPFPATSPLATLKLQIAPVLEIGLAPSKVVMATPVPVALPTRKPVGTTAVMAGVPRFR